MCISLIACKKETAAPTSTTSSNSNSLMGVWEYIHTVNNISYKCNWTFNNDGTMVINDEYDGFNGQTINYTYFIFIMYFLDLYFSLIFEILILNVIYC